MRVAFLAGLSLFAELLLIRWLDAQFRILVFTRNVPLVASFLGLGLGYARARSGRRDLAPFLAPLAAVAVLIGVIPDIPFGGVNVIGPSTIQANLGAIPATSWLEIAALAAAVAGTFTAVVLAMVPFGQLAGEAMAGLETLPAYAANLLGSVAGVALVFVLATFALPLWANALAVFGGVLVAVRRPRERIAAAALGLVCCSAMYALDHRSGRQRWWSPYNRIDLKPVRAPRGTGPAPATREWTMTVQAMFFQRMLDFDAPRPSGMVAVYQDPYRDRERHPRRVLVLGAGTGNDVVAALRGGAEHVDAVEIDPLIARIGRRLHPQRPYDDPRVRVIVDDARAFLQRKGPPYDLVVFGILDADLSFYSSLTSSLRLDNYIYTAEGMRAAADRLAPGGEVWATVYIERPWVVERLRDAITAGIGRAPLVRYAGADGATFVFGRPAEKVSVARAANVATDDWPFPFLRRRGVPLPIAISAVAMLLASGAVLAGTMRSRMRFHRTMFFLGAGFLLVETRLVAQLALLYGTTWRVSGVAILSVLAIAWLGTLVARRWRSGGDAFLWAGLIASLVAGWLVPVERGLGAGALGAVAMTALLALPVGFSSVVFARQVSRIASLPEALASNLAGGVLGGVLENLSLLTGVSALALVAALFYAAAVARSD